MLKLETLSPQGFEWLGALPMMIDPTSPNKLRDQLNANYQHGGGWSPTTGFTLNSDQSITYAGEPPLAPQARITINDEILIVYEYSWVLILQPSGEFEIARMD